MATPYLNVEVDVPIIMVWSNLVLLIGSEEAEKIVTTFN